MPIIISRKDGAIISAPNYTEEQKEYLLKHIIQAWMEKHPEELRKLLFTESSSDEKKQQLEAE